MPDQEDKRQEVQLADITLINEVLRSLGQIVNNMKLYGPQHKVVTQAISSTFRMLEVALNRAESINLSLADDRLLADGRDVDNVNPLIVSLTKQLMNIGATGFSLDKGMSEEEFRKLVGLITTHPDKIKEKGSFSQLVADTGLDHVTARTATYQLVTEEEVVVSREGEGKSATTEEMLAQMIALLRGEQVEDKKGISHQVAAMATDVNALADLIIDAAKIQQQQEGLEGEASLVTKVIDTVRRYYDAAMQDPSANTQQGKKQLTKTLNELEKTIEERLAEEKAEEHTENVAEPLVEAVEEMTTELAIDSLASEYARKYRGIAQSQKKILKFIKNTMENRPDAGLDLKARLIEAGLGEEDWQELVTRSKGRAPTEITGDGPVISTVLAQMLDELNVLDETQPEMITGQLEQVIGGISQELSKVSTQAEHQIQELGNKLRESAENPEEAEHILSRRDLMVMLAEIGQEICQPLSVITASVDMINAGRLGAVTPEQTEMLSLACEGTDRLQKLADKLIEVAGVPEGTNPDEAILGDIYHNKGK